jgi:hypothetical protein
LLISLLNHGAIDLRQTSDLILFYLWPYNAIARIWI